LETLQIAKEQEYQLSLQNLEKVELMDLDLARKVAELQLSRKNLATALTQGGYNIRRINSELRNIKTYIYKRLVSRRNI
jgi:hypothetical protein